MKIVSSEKYLDISSGLLLLMNINKQWKETSEGFIFDYANSNPVLIQVPSIENREKIKSYMLNNTAKLDEKLIFEKISHNLTEFITDKEKSYIGKYYTPKKLVDLVFKLVKERIDTNTTILDPAAGCGAFLNKFREYNVLGRDIDEKAIKILKELRFKNVSLDNSLYNVSRGKYNLDKSDKLVIVGNPPYNDTTSKSKKSGVNAKIKVNFGFDKDIRSNDLGISFLRSFAKLKAEYICILHPLSYLIKKSNFENKLKEFKYFYKLERGVIFSSQEFSDTQQTPFPIVAALYKRNFSGMNYKYITDFKFEIFEEKKLFVLNKIETIDGYIRKYPPKKSDKKLSDIGLYMYNFRDINSLLSSGNLTESINHHTNITIQFEDLYKYAYLNCFKRYFDKDFKFGNVSPIVRKNELEKNIYFQDAFLIDTIINNQRLNIFNFTNDENLLFKDKLKKRFNINKQSSPQKFLTFYELFFNFITHSSFNIEVLKQFLKSYLNRLKEEMINEVN